MTIKKIWISAVGGTLLALSGATHANLISNGSFELGSYNGGVFNTLGVGSTAITDWAITSGTIDWVDESLWNVSDGTKNIDMNGSNAAGALEISQTFLTDANKFYELRFDMSGNPAGPPDPKVLAVTIGLSTGIFSFSTSANGMSWPGAGYQGMVYDSKSLIFQGTGGATSLSFASTEASSYGAIIDNVTVVETPEPGTLLLLGLGFVGLGFRTKKK